MTRTQHHHHNTPQFPVYCLDWVDDTTLILGGGGGASRSGIENKLKLCRVSKDGRNVKYINELKLSGDEDAPMTLAIDRNNKQLITGINASAASVREGKNEQCRTFSFGNDKLEYVKAAGTIDAIWSDDYPYQKLTAFSTKLSLVAVGTTDNQVSILRSPSLEVVAPTFALDGELVDLDWGGEGEEWLAVTTDASLCIYHVNTNDKVTLELKQTIYPPSLDISPVAFRAARFSPVKVSPPTIHGVLNVSKTPAKRGAPRKAFVVSFGIVAGPSTAPLVLDSSQGGTVKGKEKEGSELGKWDVLVKREVAGKPITVFDVSSDGQLLAYGCSDLSIGILDSKTLAPLLKILHAHSFPPTALKFNPSASLMVSASADNTIRAVVVPASFGGVSMTLIALLVAILAILVVLVMRR
ncbi:prolactin regulatory element-binding protein [Tremella mesenterica]|uniref:Prolactin regulatory element-binding protein n=1 Tax=Tremella mesenterica TaxID=5217 RepID=A0A4Q1BMX9_TREME|nr:prolactin regulatory element-binding protein [Tremella mesenterica]